METYYEINTNGNPLSAVRVFLKSLWITADLDGMFVPIYTYNKIPVQSTTLDDYPIKPALVKNPTHLDLADPFVPVLPQNTARHMMQLAKENSSIRLGVVLRACEMRALENIKLQEPDALALINENWLIIGVDCVACFPLEDYLWRAKKAGSFEALTHLVLRNARQGGISADRFRPACQMCVQTKVESEAETPKADFYIKLLGLPVKEKLLAKVKDKPTAERLQLKQICHAPAAVELIQAHERMLTLLEQRHLKFRSETLKQLPTHYPTTVKELVAFFENCLPCQECLKACPVYYDELASLPALAATRSTGSSLEYPVALIEAANRWLARCAECGMCEQACPRGVPLAAIMNRINQPSKYIGRTDSSTYKSNLVGINESPGHN